MNKLEETVAIVLEEIKPQHTETTFAARKSAFNRLLVTVKLSVSINESLPEIELAEAKFLSKEAFSIG